MLAVLPDLFKRPRLELMGWEVVVDDAASLEFTYSSAKPKARPAELLREDSEIEALLTTKIEKRGSVMVSSILKNYRVEKGGYESSTARLAAVMKALAEKNPDLEVVGSGVKTELKRKEAPPPQQPAA